MVERVDW